MVGVSNLSKQTEENSDGPLEEVRSHSLGMLHLNMATAK